MSHAEVKGFSHTDPMFVTSTHRRFTLRKPP